MLNVISLSLHTEGLPMYCVQYWAKLRGAVPGPHQWFQTQEPVSDFHLIALLKRFTFLIGRLIMYSPISTVSDPRKGQMHLRAHLITTSPISSIRPIRRGWSPQGTGTTSTRAMSEMMPSALAALCSFVTSFLCLGTGQCVSALCIS